MGGGGRSKGGMSMFTDSMVFFGDPSLVWIIKYIWAKIPTKKLLSSILSLFTTNYLPLWHIYTSNRTVWQYSFFTKINKYSWFFLAVFLCQVRAKSALREVAANIFLSQDIDMGYDVTEWHIWTSREVKIYINIFTSVAPRPAPLCSMPNISP